MIGNAVQLLVSVRSPEEAAAALAGGADIIDGKDPLAGPLGALPPAVIGAIASVVDNRVLVTSALGDAVDDDQVRRDAAAAVAAGAVLVKIGFAACQQRRVDLLLAAAASACGRERVVAVAYADHERAGSPPPRDILDAAAAAGVAGVLLDTADKERPALRGVLDDGAVARWVTAARSAGLVAAIAGGVQAGDLPRLASMRPHIIGVRGAACEGGRTGTVTADRVRRLRAAVERSALAGLSAAHEGPRYEMPGPSGGP
jgi:uncharacterized protein (UPF0264 family)